MRPVRFKRWLRVNIAIVKAIFETATILSQKPKRPPIIIPGRSEDFGR